jgi:hypothetical protein
MKLNLMSTLAASFHCLLSEYFLESTLNLFRVVYVVYLAFSSRMNFLLIEFSIYIFFSKVRNSRNVYRVL